MIGSSHAWATSGRRLAQAGRCLSQSGRPEGRATLSDVRKGVVDDPEKRQAAVEVDPIGIPRWSGREHVRPDHLAYLPGRDEHAGVGVAPFEYLAPAVADGESVGRTDSDRAA